MNSVGASVIGPDLKPPATTPEREIPRLDSSGRPSPRRCPGEAGCASHPGGDRRQQRSPTALRASIPSQAGRGCAAAKPASRLPASAPAIPLSDPLTALRLEGDKAFALWVGLHAQQYMMPIVSEGGAWKVNQLEPLPWPLGASPKG
jgi:hypothetical protein